jgi:hypothetical protein
MLIYDQSLHKSNFKTNYSEVVSKTDTLKQYNLVKKLLNGRSYTIDNKKFTCVKSLSILIYEIQIKTVATMQGNYGNYSAAQLKKFGKLLD